MSDRASGPGAQRRARKPSDGAQEAHRGHSGNGKVPVELVPPPESLVTELIEYTARFVVMTPQQRLVHALWLIHTHAIQAAEQTPYLSITSPQRRCGKSRLLEVTGLLAREPLSTANSSAPALFRMLATIEPTLLMDEMDATFGKRSRPSERAEDLRGILNDGFRRSNSGVLRCVGPRHQVKRFKVFSPKAFAGIGTLPDTIADRSIPIRLEAKTRADSVQRFLRRTEEPRAAALRAQIAAWADSHVKRLSRKQPAMPAELDDRMIEGCEPLVAIAELLGCGPQARAAVVALCAGDRLDSDDAMGHRMLVDVRAVWEAREKERRRRIKAMATTRLLALLRDIDDAPWGRYYGRPLDARGLAGLLKPYGIPTHTTVRLGDKTKKGYRRRDLVQAWERYT